MRTANSCRTRLWPWVGSMMALALAAAPAFADAPIESLDELSLEELSELQVTSVSKSPELLQRAPAAIFVVTRDDIVRNGFTTIAEALRLAPNLQITQFSSSRYDAGARGFAGAEEAQNFSNKLLILIDGRSVYSPLFSGVYLDVQDVLMDDIDRIEVISGPGATLWGANAMNGVINIITRPAYVTDSSFISAGGGTDEQILRGRYGHRVSEALSYRVYAKALRRDALEQASGADAGDDWNKVQGGFRADWTGEDDAAATLQGDFYHGSEGRLGGSDTEIEGGNLLGRRQWRGERSEWQFQGYYDYTLRGQPNDGLAMTLHTIDAELQERLSHGLHRIVWGVGLRTHHYEIQNDPSGFLGFEPANNNLLLANLFAQDTIVLARNLDLTLGLKIERATYAGWSPLPDLRLAWRAADDALVWASASRAIRTPTPFDHDVFEVVPGAIMLTGNPDFRSEKVNAFEIGYRAQPSDELSYSASVFYNLYDDLRTVELRPGPPGVLVLQWDNQMRGAAWGFEAWAKWQATSWWRLSPGLRLLRKSLEYKPGASAIVGTQEAGNDPSHQWLLNSSMDLNENLSFDTILRHVGALPNPGLEGYEELSASVNQRIGEHLDVSLSGFNLLHDGHRETPSGEVIGRSVIAQARWRF